MNVHFPTLIMTDDRCIKRRRTLVDFLVSPTSSSTPTNTTNEEQGDLGAVQEPVLSAALQVPTIDDEFAKSASGNSSLIIVSDDSVYPNDICHVIQEKTSMSDAEKVNFIENCR